MHKSGEWSSLIIITIYFKFKLNDSLIKYVKELIDFILN